MIHLTADTQILLATQPADFRQGIDGLAAVCRSRLLGDPRSGILFVFINRSKTMIRTLAYDGTGFWLMTKRLSAGKFPHWPTSDKVICPMQAKQLRQLLSGVQADLLWQKTGG
ncbi:MAG TPA: IS66 family insertion sequence element accessory protein TnpB [Psychromonas sp.]